MYDVEIQCLIIFVYLKTFFHFYPIYNSIRVIGAGIKFMFCVPWGKASKHKEKSPVLIYSVVFSGPDYYCTLILLQKLNSDLIADLMEVYNKTSKIARK